MELNEGRPKLVKFNIKKNKSKWTLKDIDNNKRYYMKINQANAEYRLNNFLQNIKAKDDTHPRSKSPMEYSNMVSTLMNGKSMNIWVQSNKISEISKTYFTEEKEFISMKDFLKNDQNT